MTKNQKQGGLKLFQFLYLKTTHKWEVNIAKKDEFFFWATISKDYVTLTFHFCVVANFIRWHDAHIYI